jgi:hypothetical protein
MTASPALCRTMFTWRWGTCSPNISGLGRALGKVFVTATAPFSATAPKS